MENLPKAEKFKDGLRRINTFRFLSESELASLLDRSSVLRYTSEEIIIEEGEVSPYFFGIVEGTLSVSVAEPGGKHVFVSALGPGDVFGEAGIFIKVKRTARVSAQSDAVVVRFHRQDIIDFIRKFPEAGNKIMFVIVFGLLRKLKSMNQELAYERKSEMVQDDIDSLMDNFFKEQGM
jgi:CRP-like cAMP-binding protein